MVERAFDCSLLWPALRRLVEIKIRFPARNSTKSRPCIRDAFEIKHRRCRDGNAVKHHKEPAP